MFYFSFYLFQVWERKLQESKAIEKEPEPIINKTATQPLQPVQQIATSVGPSKYWKKNNNNEIINNVNNKVNKHLRDIMAFKYDFYFIAASITHQLTMPPANLIQQTLLQYSQVSSLIE